MKPDPAPPGTGQGFGRELKEPMVKAALTMAGATWIREGGGIERDGSGNHGTDGGAGELRERRDRHADRNRHLHPGAAQANGARQVPDPDMWRRRRRGGIVKP